MFTIISISQRTDYILAVYRLFLVYFGYMHAYIYINIFLSFSCASQVQKLQSILKPMMLRRLKEDVEKNLAPKQETIIEVCVSGARMYWYV